MQIAALKTLSVLIEHYPEQDYELDSFHTYELLMFQTILTMQHDLHSHMLQLSHSGATLEI